MTTLQIVRIRLRRCSRKLFNVQRVIIALIHIVANTVSTAFKRARVSLLHFERLSLFSRVVFFNVSYEKHFEWNKMCCG